MMVHKEMIVKMGLLNTGCIRCIGFLLWQQIWSSNYALFINETYETQHDKKVAV
jgi:hypothetical protein